MQLFFRATLADIQWKPMARTKTTAAPGKPPTLAELKRKLTPKQLKLAHLLATEGISKTEAFRRAYNTDGYSKPKYITDSASKVCSHVGVMQATDLIREAYNRPALRDAASMRAFALSVIEDVARSEDPKDRLAAAVALGKVSTVGLFLERKEVVHRQAGMDTAIDLVERLKAVAAQLAPSVAPAIETTAVLELEPPADLATDEAPIDLSTIGNSK